METQQSVLSKESRFARDLSEQVNRYFKERNISSKKGNYSLYLKTVIFVGALVAVHTLYLLHIFPLYVSMPLQVCMGFIFAGNGFNVMHDGGHGSYSKNKTVNKIASYSLNLLGGIIHYWKIKHNERHHVETNTENDEDLVIIGVRGHPSQPLRRYHKYQHNYAFFLYLLGFLGWIFGGDFIKYFSGKIMGTKVNMSVTQHFIFWFTKIAFILLFIVWPMYVYGYLVGTLGFVIKSFTCGIVISITFQLAHFVEGTSYSEKVEGERTIHQIATTANFATDNKWYNRILSWFMGGLNYQIEHHLFPHISHVYYRELQPIVEKCCIEHGIRYTKFPSLGEAISSHRKRLWVLGGNRIENYKKSIFGI